MRISQLSVLLVLLMSVAPAVAQSNDKRLEECRAKLKAAVPINLLKDMTFKGGVPKVVIGPTWYKIDFNAKTGFARTAACFFLAGDESKSITFGVYDHMTGKKVATWEFTRLEIE